MILFFNEIGKIINEPNFKLDEPVNIENYSGLVAEYQVPEDVRCCFQNVTGNLCKQNHRHGFLVKTKSGSLTIVGNDCARERFGAESKIARDVIAFDKEKEFQRKYETLSNFLNQESEITAKFKGYIDTLNVLIKFNDKFRIALGHPNHNQLIRMDKNSNPNINVTLGFIKKSKRKDEDETLETNIKLGALAGLDSYNSEKVLSLIVELNTTISAFGLATILKSKFQEEGVKPSTDRLNAVIHRSNFLTGLENQVKSILASHERFKQNDPILFCYLVQAKRERVKAAHYLSSVTGYLVNQPNVLLNELDSKIKTDHNADYVSI